MEASVFNFYYKYLLDFTNIKEIQKDSSNYFWFVFEDGTTSRKFNERNFELRLKEVE